MMANDNKTMIAFLTAGSYFGEIGVLLQKKRSSTVASRTTTILYAISKPDLLRVLENWPKHKKFLRAVGRQRLNKSSPKDIDKKEINEEFQIRKLIKTLPED